LVLTCVLRLASILHSASMSATKRPTALVIGASRGIGRGVLAELSAAGFDAYGTVRSLGGTDSNVVLKDNLIKADLTDTASLTEAAKALSQELKSKHGGAEPGLDVLVINGAVASQGPYLTLSPEDHLHAYDTNVAGPLRAIQAFLPLLCAGPTKYIFIVSSLAANANWSVQTILSPKEARSPVSGGPYSATKAALNLLGAGIYHELEDEGFKVTLVHPGLVRSDMAKPYLALLQAHEEKTGEKHPYEVLSPEESASGIVKVIQDVSAKAGGDLRFVDWKGDAMPW